MSIRTRQLHPVVASAAIGSVALLSRLMLLAFVVLQTPIPAKAVDLDELTVVTMARDGAWGVATAGSQGQAIAAAIRDCRRMAGALADCGAQFITARGGWVVAGLCGHRKIMVTGAARGDAERAARMRELEIKRLPVPEPTPCRWLLAVDPHGVVLAVEATPSAHQIDAHSKER
jgi:hypothetical protein